MHVVMKTDVNTEIKIFIDKLILFISCYHTFLLGVGHTVVASAGYFLCYSVS